MNGGLTGPAEPVFELCGVTKTYPGSPPVPALRQVNLRISAGERVAVLGPSGCGKTTLLHVLGTLERPTGGVVRVTGREVSALPDAELSALRAYQLGFVFQQFHLLDHLDALDNVAVGLLYRGEPASDRRAAATEALRRVGLAGRRSHRPAQLSGGERQRVAIARAVAGRPGVILADEPTGNLDSAAGAGIIALLSDLADDGTAVVVVTHDAEVAAAMQRRVQLLDGQVISDSGGRGDVTDRPVARDPGARDAAARDAAARDAAARDPGTRDPVGRDAAGGLRTGAS